MRSPAESSTLAPSSRREEDAYDAARVFEKALIEARPNARDYYVAGDGAFREANDQHLARLRKLKEVMDDLVAIAQGVQSQGR